MEGDKKKIKRKSIVGAGFDLLVNKIERSRSVDSKKEDESKKSPLTRKYRRTMSSDKAPSSPELEVVEEEKLRTATISTTTDIRKTPPPPPPRRAQSKLSLTSEGTSRVTTSSSEISSSDFEVEEIKKEEEVIVVEENMGKGRLFISSEIVVEITKNEDTQEDLEVQETKVENNNNNNNNIGGEIKEKKKRRKKRLKKIKTNDEENEEGEVENEKKEEAELDKGEVIEEEEEEGTDSEYDETEDDESEESYHGIILSDDEKEESKEIIEGENEEEIKEEKKEEEPPGEVVFDDSHINYAEDMWGVPDNEKSVILNSETCTEFQMRAATLGKLVERLSNCESKNSIEHKEYLKVFFMTYRSYADPVDIFNRLVKRFKGPEVPEGVHICEVVPNIYQIRKSVCISIVHWFTNHYRDFCNSNKLLEILQAFIIEAAKLDADNKESTVNYLDKMVQKKVNKGTYTSLFASDIMIDKSTCPDPILPKDLNNATFMQIDEIEIARQLTISEYHIYAEIQPVELQDLAWSKAHLKERAPNVLEMIEKFNKFSHRCASLVVSQPKIKERKKVIEKLVKIAEHLLELNSFNMTMAIMSGLSNSAIYRMKHSFEGLSRKALETLETLQQSLSSNQSYKAYREVTSNITPPAIPFVGVYLSDLTFVDEGNPNKVNGLINFRKKQLEYDVIVQVLKYQNLSYNYKMVPKIISILNGLPILSENEMYKLSLEYEPRNAKKKEIK